MYYLVGKKDVTPDNTEENVFWLHLVIIQYRNWNLEEHLKIVSVSRYAAHWSIPWSCCQCYWFSNSCWVSLATTNYFAEKGLIQSQLSLYRYLVFCGNLSICICQSVDIFLTYPLSVASTHLISQHPPILFQASKWQNLLVEKSYF